MKQIIVLWFFCLSLTVSAQKSVSHLIIDSLQSQYLKNIRKFCLYLPPQFNSQQAYPIIVATDGQTLEEGNYKSVLDSLITAKRVKPFVLIGAYADETPACGVTVRNLEYLKSRKGNKMIQTYFNNHYQFFTKELIKEVFANYHLKTQEPFIFYGCSNGGDFGLLLYSQKEPMFNRYICLSPLSTKAEDFKYNKQVRLYVAFGDKELAFPYGVNLEGLHKKMQKYKGKEIFVHSYKGGHEREKWLAFFCDVLTKQLLSL